MTLPALLISQYTSLLLFRCSFQLSHWSDDHKKQPFSLTHKPHIVFRQGLAVQLEIFLCLVSTLISMLEVIIKANCYLLLGQDCKEDKLYPLLTASLPFQQHLKIQALSYENLFSSTHMIKNDATGVKELLNLDISILLLLQLHAFDFSVWS